MIFIKTTQSRPLSLSLKRLNSKKPAFMPAANAILQYGFEQQLFDLTNAARVRHGLHSLKWEDRRCRNSTKAQ